MNEKVEPPFKGKAVSSYNEGPPRQVPGYSDLHRMISLLLTEVTPQDGRLLVLGAGGGQEIKALADAHAGWCFDGVDPSADMLQLANTVIAAHDNRVRLFEGYIEDAPLAAYDAATAILTFHFIGEQQRLETLVQIRKRLKTGAPFLAVHLSFRKANLSARNGSRVTSPMVWQTAPTRQRLKARDRPLAPGFQSFRRTTTSP